MTKNKGKYPLPLSESSNMLGNLRVVSIPFVIPLIKGTMIAQGGIEDPNVVGKVVEYHSVAAEWLCLMNMESRCSSKM